MSGSSLPDATQNPRFTGLRSFMRLPGADDDKHPDVAIVGIPFDTAASFRPGQRFGPSAVRDISVLLRPSNQFHGINAFDRVNVVDSGDVPAIPGDIKTTYDLIAARYADLASKGTVPIGIGGDHSITLGELRGMAKALGPVALVQLDAHCDTWDNYWGVRLRTARRFAGRSRRDSSTSSTRSRLACAARSTRPETSTSRDGSGSR